jgi:hypothetical protein
MGKVVYVVMAERGRWEDWSHWVAGVYLDKDEARAAVEVHEKVNQEAEAARTAYWDQYNSKIKNSMHTLADAEGKRRIEQAVFRSLGGADALPPWDQHDDIEYSIEEIPIGQWGEWS